MKKSTEKFKKEQSGIFLKQASENKNLSSKHKEMLGFEKPEAYFSKSKKNILELLTTTETAKPKIFGLKPLFAYSIAASIILLIGLTFLLQMNTNKTVKNTTEFYFTSNESLLNSLLISDENVDHYMDQYILNDIIIASEVSNQKIENIFMNSLLIDDTAVDTYLDESIIENFLL
jgi:hypothetical protein